MLAMKTYNILFLCTANSSRSILGEMAATLVTNKKFIGYSAGSKPSGIVNTCAIKIARELNYPLSKLYSKSLDSFLSKDAPWMDMVITVCDNAAKEECPLWSGKTIKGHWGFPDPANIENKDNQLTEFRRIFQEIQSRLETISSLKFETLSVSEIEEKLKF